MRCPSNRGQPQFHPERGPVRLLLIPLTHALPAVKAYLDAQADDWSPLTTDELETIARPAPCHPNVRSAHV